MIEYFNSISVTEIEGFVRDRRQEDLHLDFKLLSSVDDINRDDRKNLAISISGFANSDGGIIVWGVDSRKDPETGIDSAINCRPLVNGRLILSRLQAYTGQATSPVVPNVLHKFIPTIGNSGFIITYIPSCDAGPFMAKLGEDRYYKRSGDSFYKMEHYDIQDMFGRRRKPSLSLILNKKSGTVNNEIIEETYQICLLNNGKCSAKFPGAFIEFENCKIKSINGLNDLSLLNEGRCIVGFEDNIGVIHPNGIVRQIGIITITRPIGNQFIIIKGKIYCDDSPSIDINYPLNANL
jgi:Putative DNA-binding domain